MKQLRIYLDTSVIGGCFDREFEIFSSKLLAEINSGKMIGVFSDVTADELANAPDFIQDNFAKIQMKYIEKVVTNQEMISLADTYLSHKIVTANYKEDALHIAIATVSRVDVLVSWNFKHIVNLDRIHKFNAINLLEGYQLLEIRSPKELGI